MRRPRRPVSEASMEGRETQMRLLTKAGLGLAVLLVSIAIAPAAKADPITIQSSGFGLQGLANNGSGANGADSLIGAAASSVHTVFGAVDVQLQHLLGRR